MIYAYSKNEAIKALCAEADALRIDCVSIPMSLAGLSRFQSEQKTYVEKSILLLSYGYSPLRDTDGDFLEGLRSILHDQSYNWAGYTSKTLTPKQIRELLSVHKQYDNPPQKDIEQILNFTQTNTDHPLINAALLFAGIVALLPHDPLARSKATLCSRYILAASGLDIFGCLNYEDILLGREDVYTDVLLKLTLTHNATYWIQFMLETFIESLRSLRTKLQDEKNLPSSRSNPLSVRQIALLQMFTNEGVMLSNREIRKNIKLSPVTTSRELANLVKHNYLLPIGRGRSIRYTKVI